MLLNRDRKSRGWKAALIALVLAAGWPPATASADSETVQKKVQETDYSPIIARISTETGKVRQSAAKFDTGLLRILNDPKLSAKGENVRNACDYFLRESGALRPPLDMAATEVTNVLRLFATAAMDDPSLKLADAVVESLARTVHLLENRRLLAAFLGRAAQLSLVTDSITGKETDSNFVIALSANAKTLSDAGSAPWQLRREWRSLRRSFPAALSAAAERYLDATTDAYQARTSALRLLQSKQSNVASDQYEAAKAVFGPRLGFRTTSGVTTLIDPWGYNLTGDRLQWDIPTAARFPNLVTAEILIADNGSNAAVYWFLDKDGVDVTRSVLHWSAVQKRQKLAIDQLKVKSDGKGGYSAEGPEKSALSPPVPKRPAEIDADVQRVLGALPQATTTDLGRVNELPYREPAQVYKVGARSASGAVTAVDFSALPRQPGIAGAQSQKYLWVLRADGQIWIAPEAQAGYLGSMPGSPKARLHKHRDLALTTPAEGNSTKSAPARLGGELWFENDRWVFNNDSSYCFNSIRLDGINCLNPEHMHRVVELLGLYGCQNTGLLEVQSK